MGNCSNVSLSSRATREWVFSLLQVLHLFPNHLTNLHLTMGQLNRFSNIRAHTVIYCEWKCLNVLPLILPMCVQVEAINIGGVWIITRCKVFVDVNRRWWLTKYVVCLCRGCCRQHHWRPKCRPVPQIRSSFRFPSQVPHISCHVML